MLALLTAELGSYRLRRCLRHFDLGRSFASTLEKPPSGGFSIFHTQIANRKTAQMGGFSLLLHLLEGLVLSSLRIELLELDLALHLLLILARVYDVAGGAL